MVAFDVDLFVIGGGSGGVRAARIAAGHGAKVMLAEEFRVGGTCVIRGCVPKKLFVYAGRFADAFDDAAELGWSLPSPAHFDWPRLVAAKDREISRLEQRYTEGQEAAGVEIVKSRAEVEDAHTVRIAEGGARVRARVILVATGSRPETVPFEGLDLTITSNEVFDLPAFPERLVIAGAGYIAVELAGVFGALGSDVTVICRGDNVLRGFDEDLREAVAESFQDRGVKLMFNDAITSVRRDGAGRALGVATQNGARLGADQVLLAYGRVPNTRGLGLERAGVALGGRGEVIVDADSRSTCPSIYAVGDVTNRFNLTPAAIREGHAFADAVFGGQSRPIDLSLVPTAVFTTPEVGTVGLTETEARERHPAVDVYKSRFLSLSASVSGSRQRTLVKTVVDGDTRRLLGVHLFADAAAEMIQLMTVALRAGATMDDLTASLAVHPTLGEEIVTLRSPTARHRREAGDATSVGPPPT